MKTITEPTTAEYVKNALETLAAMSNKEKLDFAREVSKGFDDEIEA